MRFDQDAYWGLGIGAAIMGRVPLIGGQLVKLMLGGPIIAGETLSRFFALHVFVIPGMLLAFVGVHLLMVLKLGINEWPVPGRLVKRETYLKEYHEETQKDGIPFIPDAFRKDLVFFGIIFLALVVCAAVFGPFGPNGPRPDHRADFTRARFLSSGCLRHWPSCRQTWNPSAPVGPIVGLSLLILLPLMSGTGRKAGSAGRWRF
jgi:ubiquinol-cytochrome c reductase cytochrome b subunit